MMIQSRTTNDRKIRIAIFLVMCTVFSLYFAYDGYRGYPNKNLKWARQSLSSIPGLPEPGELRTNSRAMLAELKKVEPGMPLGEVRERLGEPTFAREADIAYVGPASFGWYKIENDKIGTVVQVQQNTEPSEGDIFGQKVFALITGALAAGTLLHLIRVTRMRWILDEAGLQAGSRRIPWDDMIELDRTDWQRKGWVDLVYRAGSNRRPLRLDSYFIEHFDDILGAICERKGFQPLPRRGKSAAPAQADDADDNAEQD